MKTSILSLFALTISAALAFPVQAGGHGYGGGGGIGFNGGGGGHISLAPHVAGPSFRAAPGAGFRGSRLVAPGQHFSSIGMRSPNSFRLQHVITSNVASRRFDGPRTVNHPESRLARNGNDSGHRFENRGTNAANAANAAREHVFARRSADWHRDWDRHHDHWWNGHRCRFVNGSWFIYDIGFYPYDYWYPYDYYPYEYDAGVYEGGGADYYGQGAYDSSEQYADSTVVAAQEQLARQGYYRGEIDGLLGPETRRAIARYQGDRGMRVTGSLTNDTLDALGLQRVASN